ncbi:hypothetical protein M885DRAFT_620259 [Pelagophyceae sp. CCMP2097]|nr:hypothetical protein M885DRAFT_620259 [Pelagophyceae sp. CCMP2097]
MYGIMNPEVRTRDFAAAGGAPGLPPLNPPPGAQRPPPPAYGGYGAGGYGGGYGAGGAGGAGYAAGGGYGAGAGAGAAGARRSLPDERQLSLAGGPNRPSPRMLEQRRSPRAVVDVGDAHDFPQTDSKAVAALARRVRDADADRDDLRRDADDVRASQREVLQRLSAATHEVRERGEVARRAHTEDVRELRVEVAAKVAAAEQRLAAALARDDDRAARESAQLAELRGAVAALRDDAQRALAEATNREQRVVEAARAAGDQAQRAAQATVRDNAEHVAAALRAIETLSRDVDQARRSTAEVAARVDGELHAGRAAMQRATAAAGHADAVAANTEAEVTDRLRTELRALEQRLGGDVARCRAELHDEARRREGFAAELDGAVQRAQEQTADRVAKCEDAVRDLAASRRRIAPRGDQRSTQGSVQGDEGDAPRAASVAGSDDDDESARAAAVGAARAQARHSAQLAMVEAQLGKAVAEATRASADAAAQQRDRAAAQHDDLRKLVDGEKAGRALLEAASARAIQSAVKSLASAFRAEQAKLEEQLGSLELRARSTEATFQQRLDDRASAIEEALVDRVAERERELDSIRGDLGQLGHNLRAEAADSADRLDGAAMALEKRVSRRADEALKGAWADLEAKRTAFAEKIYIKVADVKIDVEVGLERIDARHAATQQHAADDALRARGSLAAATADVAAGLAAHVAGAHSAQARQAVERTCAGLVDGVVDRDADRRRSDESARAAAADAARALEGAVLAEAAAADRAALDARLRLSDERHAAAAEEARSAVDELRRALRDELAPALARAQSEIAALHLAAADARRDADARAAVAAVVGSIVDAVVDAAAAQAQAALRADVDHLRLAAVETAAAHAAQQKRLSERVDGLEAAARRNAADWADTVSAAAGALRTGADLGPAPPAPPRGQRPEAHVRSVFPA